MSWGDSFKSAWNSATDAARSATSAIATGAKAVSDGAAAAAQFMACEAKDIAATAGNAAVAAGRKTVDAAIWAADQTKKAAVAATNATVAGAEWAADQAKKAAITTANAAVAGVEWAADKTKKAAVAGAAATVAGAEWVADETRRAVVAVADFTVAAAKVTAHTVAAVFAAAKQAFAATVAGVATACAAAENWIFADILFNASFVLSKPGISDALRPLLRLSEDNPKDPNSQKRYDGDVLGAGCQKDKPGGVLPSGCYQSPGTLPKIVYINGINTRYTPDKDNHTNGLFGGGICQTMSEIASRTCSEVTGVYNATQGMAKDLDRCLDDIARKTPSRAVDPLREMMVKAALSGQKLTIFAHSEGGLITQDAVVDAKQQLILESRPHLTAEEAEQKLSNVSIKSFGTALMGWPKGPHYERFTNTADPVPPVIIGAQTSYPVSTWKDSASADPNSNHVFTTPDPNPFSFKTHDINTTYLNAYSQIKGAPGCACKTA